MCFIGLLKCTESKWVRGRGRGKSEKCTKPICSKYLSWFSFLHAYLLIYMHIIYTSESPHCTSSKRASEQYAKGKEAFCIFTYIGVIAFHVLKRSRLSIMHVRKRERESTQRMPRHVDFTNVMQMQCNRFNRLCACWCLHFSRLQFFTCNASSFIY